MKQMKNVYGPVLAGVWRGLATTGGRLRLTSRRQAQATFSSLSLVLSPGPLRDFSCLKLLSNVIVLPILYTL